MAESTEKSKATKNSPITGGRGKKIRQEDAHLKTPAKTQHDLKSNLKIPKLQRKLLSPSSTHPKGYSENCENGEFAGFYILKIYFFGFKWP